MMRRGGLRRWAALFYAALAVADAHAGAGAASGLPPRDYVILINHELGMHCTGFDLSYCCVLPPYNSILAQVIRTERAGDRPVLLAEDPEAPGVLVDGDRRFRLAYTHEDPAGVPNTYSASKKLVYWGVPYKGGALPDHYFSHLYSYDEGVRAPEGSVDADKRRVGVDTRIGFNRGPTGQHVGRGFLEYSGDDGTVMLTDAVGMENVPVKLSNGGLWEALGLPLTPFNDEFTALTRLDESMVQPYQKSVVTLVDAGSGEPVTDSSGKVVRFFGVNPVDVPNCARCHATERANGERYVKHKLEYAFWREVRGASQWYAELKAAAISILEIHDARHGTDFLRNWPAGPNTYTRLGRDAVLCQDCHADNAVGRFVSLKAGEMAAADVQADHPGLPAPEHIVSPLSEAIHRAHQRHSPLPDARGFAGGCQACHPAHRSDGALHDFPLTADGDNAFASSDIRMAPGCFNGRDVHGNPDRDTAGAETPSHLNAVGEYLLLEVMSGDRGDRGLHCTHCHNRLSRELYRADRLTDAVSQSGQSLRALELEAMAEALGLSLDRLLSEYLDPRVPREGPDTTSGVYRLWDRSEREVAALARLRVDDDGRPVLTPPDADGDRSVIIEDIDPAGVDGMAVPYDAVTHGRDYWLAPGEPHCADCHQPPFVESMGGGAFPIDQPGKYALMRYSKGHAGITCQGCHESAHGLHPVNPRVDVASFEQARLLNADGSHGPVKCATCHRVNEAGVPTGYPDLIDPADVGGTGYDEAVRVQHTLR